MLMRALRFSPMLLALVFIGFIGSCAQAPDDDAEEDPVSPPATVPVVMSLVDAIIGFEPETVVVGRGDHISWENTLGGPVTIHLERVPVTPTVLEIAPGETGFATVLDEARDGRYKYAVTLVREADTIVADPYVGVEPKREG